MIYIECDADEILVKCIGFTRSEIEHKRDKGRICNAFMKAKNLVGLADEDPQSNPPLYIKQLALLEDKDGIKHLYDKERNNHLFLLCPRLEDWIVDTANTANIEIDKFGLPRDKLEFWKIINLRKKNFTKLVEALKTSKSKRYSALKNFLSK